MPPAASSREATARLVRAATVRRGALSVAQPSRFVFGADQISSAAAVTSAATRAAPLEREVFLLAPEPRSRLTTFMRAVASDADAALEFRAASAEALAALPAVEWTPCLDPTTLDARSAMSREEQLLRERQRATSRGVTDFHFCHSTNDVVFAAGGELFCARLEAHMTPTALQLTAGPGVPLDPSLSHDGALVAFVRDGDLHVFHRGAQQHQQLTHVHAADFKHSAGVADYIVQEEFDRYTGYWWCPTATADITPGEQTYRILYFEIDESMVPVLSLPSPDGATEPFMYPRVGEPNARSSLRMAEIVVGPHGIVRTQLLRLACELADLMPGAEYAPRAGWLASLGAVAWVQLLDRAQQHSMHLSLCMSDFVPFDAPSPGVPRRVLFSDETDLWINVHDLFHSLESSPVVIVGSERDGGYRHLFAVRHDSMGRALETWPVTSGSWMVERLLGVRESNAGTVFFLGTADTALESHVYAVELSGSLSHPVRLSSALLCHTVTMDRACSMFVSVYSSVDVPNSTVLGDIEHASSSPRVLARLQPPSSASTTASTADAAADASPLPTIEFRAPHVFVFTGGDGTTSLFGCRFLPPDFDPDQKYPLIVYVYGGPHVQLVRNDYRLTMMTRAQIWAQLGYVVAIFDGHGSSNRGLHFEGALRCKMGQVELDDQVAGVKHLIAEGYVDPARVGITGWSYGGYMTLLAMCKRPDVFRVGVSGAPVTRWELYDTGYTERYMSTRDAAADAFDAGSILTSVGGFPSEPHRLMIVHGLIDENVHFRHTAELLQALAEANKPYDLQLYPKERHGVRQPVCAAHLETTSAQYFVDHL